MTSRINSAIQTIDDLIAYTATEDNNMKKSPLSNCISPNRTLNNLSNLKLLFAQYARNFCKYKIMPQDIINLLMLFYYEPFEWTLDENKIVVFIKSIFAQATSIQDILDKLSEPFQTNYFIVNDIPFKTSFFIAFSGTNDRTNIYYMHTKLSFQIQPINATNVNCYFKMWSDDANIALNKPKSKILKDGNMQHDFILCGNWLEHPKIALSLNKSKRYKKYLNVYNSAIDIGYDCFWCIPTDKSQKPKYVAFLLAKNSKNQTVLDEAKEKMMEEIDDLKIVSIREWTITVSGRDGKLNRYKSRGFLIDCKDSAYKIKELIQYFILDKFGVKKPGWLTHCTTICRFVLKEFADRFMKVGLLPKHLKPKPGHEVCHKPQGPKYLYSKLEFTEPTIEGMIKNKHAVIYNEYHFEPQNSKFGLFTIYSS
eukprot:6150_1